MKKVLMILAGIFTAVIAYADSPASYPGGKEALDTYIKDNLKYPETAKENGIEGIVEVVFTVKTDGTLGSMKIKRMIDPDLEAEALRLVKGMPKWNPAIKGDAPVESTADVKVPFELE